MKDFFESYLEGSIAKSLLGIDFYKFTMGQVILRKYPDVSATFAFKNRTKNIRMRNHIDLDELEWQLDQVAKLRFNKTELHYLRGTNEYQERMFCEEYLQSLEGFKLPQYRLGIDVVDAEIKLEFPGQWSVTTYWETIALAIVSELYYRGFLKKMTRFERNSLFAQGQLRLSEKIKALKERKDITFSEFGTRRRFSRAWQDYVVRSLAEELPPSQFIGTSNTYLAMKYGVMPIGTKAHEMDMVMAGIADSRGEDITQSVSQSLRDWWEQYGWGLSIALPDTFGTDFFFRSMTPEQAKDWKGLRQDSGDPILFGEKAITFYKSCGVDPREKLIVFSDGLDLDMIFKIADHFKGRLNVTFGWGTNLTNDLGFPPISLVVKTVEANGQGLVKLSDNLAKSIGGPKDIERYKRAFGYTGENYEECRY